MMEHRGCRLGHVVVRAPCRVSQQTSTRGLAWALPMSTRKSTSRLCKPGLAVVAGMYWAFSATRRRGATRPAKDTGETTDAQEENWWSKFTSVDVSVFQRPRAYATRTALERALEGLPVRLKDLSRKNGPNVPLSQLESPIYRGVAFLTAFAAYPTVVRCLRSLLYDDLGGNTDDLADVVTEFVTVETFVFGSYAGVTLQVQMQRLADLQTESVKESALLSGLSEHTVGLFDSLDKTSLRSGTGTTVAKNEDKALLALWHHSERMAYGTRGVELMDIADRDRQSDSISNYRQALLKWGRMRREQQATAPLYEPDLQVCLGMLNNLRDFRAGRLSRESLTLPPTFFWTFGLLSIFISISFALREAADPNSEFSIVDRCFFATLTLAFLTLFRLAVDVNFPFGGDYQIRRGALTAELVAARTTLAKALGPDKLAAYRAKEATKRSIDENDLAPAVQNTTFGTKARKTRRVGRLFLPVGSLKSQYRHVQRWEVSLRTFAAELAGLISQMPRCHMPGMQARKAQPHIAKKSHLPMCSAGRSTSYIRQRNRENRLRASVSFVKCGDNL
ncbi:hypothetical protein AK812_SmicGene39272 [Symbiodinium microadriaticum]|uniref:Uncharacterized protein n=1 Tax=Symbiodinium microadriaticum TaxID=2951 RepID=A0A1Q9CBQ0_SYMMI|nr:hypothetical protein AK812_SmicGene39272 [Symbiodinium microadriaticum]